MRNGAIPTAGVLSQGQNMGCYGGRCPLEMFAPDPTWSPPHSTGFDPTARTASSSRGPVAAGAVTGWTCPIRLPPRLEFQAR